MIFLAIIAAFVLIQLVMAAVTCQRRSERERGFQRSEHDDLRYWAGNLKYAGAGQWRRMLKHAARCEDCRVFLGNALRDQHEEGRLDELLREL